VTAALVPPPSLHPATAGGCGLLDISCHVDSAITGWFASLVGDAVNGLLTVIGKTALSTPQPAGMSSVQAFWQLSDGIADGSYVLLVLIGAVIIMGYETVQTSYSVKEIAPRMVTGFLAANLSLVLITQAVTMANGLSLAFTARGVNPQTAAKSLLGVLAGSATTGGVFLILLCLAGVILALVFAVVYVIRVMALVLLAGAAPVALALYALPQTAWAARWWCRALTACLSVQVAQALVLTAAARVFFSGGWLAWQDGGLTRVLITLCLLYILMRIPFWVARPVLSGFGSSPVRRAARFAVSAAILSRVAPVLRGGSSRRPAARRRRPAPRSQGHGQQDGD
jgi:hypothetical protein